MFHQKIYQGMSAFLITLLSVLLLNSNQLDARETHHTKNQLKTKSHERSAKYNGIRSKSKSSSVRNALRSASTSANRTKGSARVSNSLKSASLKSASRAKGAAIHFGPGPGATQAIHFGPGPGSTQAIHFGPGPGATQPNVGRGTTSTIKSAKTHFLRHASGKQLPAIHFGPGPGKALVLVTFGHMAFEREITFLAFNENKQAYNLASETSHFRIITDGLTRSLFSRGFSS